MFSRLEENSICYEDSASSERSDASLDKSARFLKDSNSKTLDSKVVLPEPPGEAPPGKPTSREFFANFETWNRNKVEHSPKTLNLEIREPSAEGLPEALQAPVGSIQFEPDESIMDAVLRNFEQDSCDPTSFVALEPKSEAEAWQGEAKR